METLKKNNYIVFTLYSGYHFFGIQRTFHYTDPDFKIIKDNLTKDEAENFAKVMDKLKEIR